MEKAVARRYEYFTDDEFDSIAGNVAVPSLFRALGQEMQTSPKFIKILGAPLSPQECTYTGIHMDDLCELCFVNCEHAAAKSPVGSDCAHLPRR